LVESFISGIIVGFIVLVISDRLEDSRQNRIYENNAYFEILKIQYSDKKQIAEDFSRLVEKRYFYSESLYESILENNTDEKLRLNYKSSIDDWNIQKDYLRLRMITYFGYDYVKENLITDESDLKNKMPITLHYKFVKLHNNLKILLFCKADCYGLKNETKLILSEIKNQKEKIIDDLIEKSKNNYNTLKEETSYDLN
jgi:hypothetical protein